MTNYTENEKTQVFKGIIKCTYDYFYNYRAEVDDSFKLQDLAKNLGIHVNTLRNILDGKTLPGPVIIIRMVNLYNVSADTLLGIKKKGKSYE